MATTDEANVPKPARRWFQFRLRTFLVLLLLLSCVFGWIMRERSQLVQWRLKLKELGGGRGYSSSQPRWHYFLFGADPGYYVPDFYFNDPQQVGDESLKHLEGLKNLEGLSLSGTKVTDDGLLMLRNFPKLVWLEIRDTQITDAGLANLKDCNIYRLEVAGTRVTKTGRLNFYKSHPNAKISPILNE
jgi:hypothetical protein